ncbi:MAG: hypothetical protein ACREMV_09490 [Gemmatimonadales bacterium]
MLSTLIVVLATWAGPGERSAISGLVTDATGAPVAVTYPLPTRHALIRHMDIDPGSGAVWAAYSPAPAVAPRVVRLELRR